MLQFPLLFLSGKEKRERQFLIRRLSLGCVKDKDPLFPCNSLSSSSSSRL
ncbi:hypothetical protein QQP08_006307 [Theobroma cacao]|nr:hypothetical protein QQP08_006307 [Theobroma cacao]